NTAKFRRSCWSRRQTMNIPISNSTHPSRRATPSGLRISPMPRAAWRAGYVLVLISSLSIAKEPISEPLTHYMGREIAVTMHYTGAPWLVRESRQREEDCEQLLKALDLKTGQVICDMGCGNGFYTSQMAQLVGPEGKVIAVDIQSQ